MTTALGSAILTALVAVSAGIGAGEPGAAHGPPAGSCGRPVAFGPATPPFRPSVQLSGLSEARKRVAFAPRVPPGRPFRVYVSSEREVRLRRLGLAYRGGPSHWFLLSQARLFVSASRFERSLREQAERMACGARASTFRLRDGTLAC